MNLFDHSMIIKQRESSPCPSEMRYYLLLGNTIISVSQYELDGYNALSDENQKIV
jgi:hypothetical protein